MIRSEAGGQRGFGGRRGERRGGTRGGGRVEVGGRKDRDGKKQLI